ncbi:MAG: hypothetical protein ABR968_08475 [Bacteroidales bacterium]
MLLVFASNPNLRGEKDTAEEIHVKPQKVPIVTSINAVFLRTCLTPGKVIVHWFDLIPSKRPYLYGCGYRFLQPFTGCDQYYDYASLIYIDLYPEYYKHGIKGSMNVASFMYEYSNFGDIGLVLSAAILSLIFVFINLLFINASFAVKFSLNIYSILVLNSSAITTLLFSGGWGLMIILFLFYKKDFEEIN